MVRGLVRAALGLGGAATWLVLLEATDFNGVTVGMGLLAAFAVIDRGREAAR